MKKILLISLGLLVNTAFSQISFDRTRVILDQGRASSQTIVLSNSSKGPYLAQAWVENDAGQKITSPLAALPILQRINGGQEKQLKISVIGDISQLPSDRESLLFLNVLGVPPKNESGSQLSIAVQSRMKLFFRPKGLPVYKESNGWVEDISVHKSGNSLTFDNTTPYYVVIYAFSAASGKDIKKDVILKPFSKETVNVNVTNNFAMMIINDFGSGSRVNYSCNSGICSGKIQAQKR